MEHLFTGKVTRMERIELIIVPQSLAMGLVSALHLRLGHPTKSQFRKIWDRYFYALDSERYIKDCTEFCSLCTSLKTLPKELFRQTTSELPNAIGKTFSADIIKRAKQKILLVMDIFSSFKMGILLPDEQGETLQQGLIQLVSDYKHPEGTKIRVDNAPGFATLRNDKLMHSLNISLDFGRVKNQNHNPTIDKAIQEVELEIKYLSPNGGPINPGILATAVSNSNSRIRSNGLSSKEMLLKRDSYTDEPIEFDDQHLRELKHRRRLQNHLHSELSKSKGTKHAISNEKFRVGQLVHVKNEGSKHSVRDQYLIMSINEDTDEAIIQKLGSNQLRSKRYRVKLHEIYSASPHIDSNNDDNDENEEEIELLKDTLDLEDNRNNVHITDPPLRRSERVTKEPEYLSTSEIERI